MNTGIALALLALAQLFLTWLSDRALNRLDRPWFIEQAKQRGNDGLGIAKFFAQRAGQEGAERVNVVLRMAGLAASARSVAATLIVSLVGSGVTAVIILAPQESPSYEVPRLVALLVAAFMVGAALLVLVIRMGAHSLVSHAAGEAAYRRGRRSPTRTWKCYWLRLRSANVITRYYTAAVLGNAITIGAAINV